MVKIAIFRFCNCPRTDTLRVASTLNAYKSKTIDFFEKLIKRAPIYFLFSIDLCKKNTKFENFCFLKKILICRSVGSKTCSKSLKVVGENEWRGDSL